MNQNKRYAIVFAAVLMTFVWALPTAAVAETIITVGGTGSALGTMKQLAGLYEKTHPGVRIRILPSLGSTAGIKAVLDGGINLGLSSRPLKQNEQQQGAVGIEYARSPFVFITNAKSSKKDITVPELERIYTDPASRWSDGGRIRLILRPEKDIDTSMVRNLSPGMEKAMKAAHARPGMIQAISDQESTDAVVKTPGALGCATLSEIISEKREVNILTFNGVKPDVKNIANGSYPLFKSMYLVITPKTPPAARDFAAFLNSRPAARILSETGNLPVTPKQGK